MRVLFAVSTDSISRSIINKYQGMYKQILSAKSVYYFDAIVKELQRDKTYDRVVISEDLEPHTDNNYERIDNNIFNKLDRITDEASNVLEGEIPIIIIGADRRTKSDPLLTKLFGIGIYNVLLGQDRSLEDVCTLINKPRTKKEAKLYYNISDVSNVTYAPEHEDTVPEEQIQSILNHFNKIGKNEPVIISSFNSIADQYSSEQLKIIIKHLPLQVRTVLETSSDRYKEFVTSGSGQKSRPKADDEEKKKRKGLFFRPQKDKNKTKYVPNQDMVINNNYVPNAVTNNNVEVVPIEPINNALSNNDSMGSVIIPKPVDINNGHSAPTYSTDNNGIQFSNEPVQPKAAPNVVSETVESTQVNPIAEPQTLENKKVETETTMPGLFVETEETSTEHVTEPTPETGATMPGLFEEVEEAPAEPVAEPTPETNATMPGLFEEIEETPTAEPVAEPTPETNATMPGLFEEIEETPTAEPVAEPTPEAGATMPGLFEEIEETPAESVVEKTPETETTIPNLFEEVEETPTETDNLVIDNPIEGEVKTPELDNEISDSQAEEGTPKRGRGRPRKYPKVEIDPNAPKRGRGRPRKAVSLNIGIPNTEKSDVTDINETIKLSKNAEFQIDKPEAIIKESVAQNLSSKYSINNFAVNNVMPQTDIFDFSEGEDNNEISETIVEDGSSPEDKNENVSENILGLFDVEDNSQEAENEIDNPVEEPKADTKPEVEKETSQIDNHIEESEEDKDLPGLFENIENMSEKEETIPETQESNTQEDELPGLFDNIENMNDSEDTIPEVQDNISNDAQEDELPGLFDSIENMDNSKDTTIEENATEDVLPETIDELENPMVDTKADELPGLFESADEIDETESDDAQDSAETDELPGLFDNIENMDNSEEVIPEMQEDNKEDELPELFNNADNVNESEESNSEEISVETSENDDLPGIITDTEELDDEVVKPQRKHENINEVDLSNAFNGSNKLVAFVGTAKNGTSFVVNNLATLISQNNVDVAVLDLTKNKDSYYVFTNNDPDLMKKGKRCIDKLIEGFYEGIQIQNNLTIYTSLPGEEEKFENVQSILSNLLKKYSLVILDCDFDTIPEYFKASQEVYLVQTYDILTIQPLTKFLRDCLEKGILSVEKLRIVINKEIKMKKLTKSLLIGGISTYNDPGLDYMKELFDPNMIMATSIPFDIDTYETYLENIVDCKISLRGYSNDFKQALAVLANMVYPLSTSRMQNNSQRITKQNDSNQNDDFNKMNDTLSKMRNNL